MKNNIKFCFTLKEEKDFLEFVLDNGYIILQKPFIIRKTNNWYENYRKRRSRKKIIYLYKEKELKDYILEFEFRRFEKIINRVKKFFMNKYSLDFYTNDDMLKSAPIIKLEFQEDYVSDSNNCFSEIFLYADVSFLDYEKNDENEYYGLKSKDFISFFNKLINYIEKRVKIYLIEIKDSNNSIRFDYYNLSKEVKDIITSENIKFKDSSNIIIENGEKIIIK